MDSDQTALMRSLVWHMLEGTLSHVADQMVARKTKNKNKQTKKKKQKKRYRQHKLLLRPPLVLTKSGLISGVVLILNVEHSSK